MCIQEHWLYRFEADFIYTQYGQCSGSIKCVDDSDPIPLKLRPRGSAGVAVLWNKKWDDHIKPLPDGGDRLQAVHITTTTDPVVLINTYMPTNGTMADIAYEEVLDEVYEVMQKYSATNKIIWIGDINASTKRPKPTSNDKLFMSFCQENKLKVHPLTPDQPTYHHFSGDASSQIDLVVYMEQQASTLELVSIDIRGAENTSLHDAIIAKTNLYLCAAAHVEEPRDRNPSTMPATNWKKVDKERYSMLITRKLDALSETLSPSTHCEIVLTVLNKTLRDSSRDCQPPPRKPKKPTRFKWYAALKPSVAASKHAFGEWKEHNPTKDSSNPYYLNMRAAKAHLRCHQ